MEENHLELYCVVCNFLQEGSGTTEWSVDIHCRVNNSLQTNIFRLGRIKEVKVTYQIKCQSFINLHYIKIKKNM